LDSTDPVGVRRIRILLFETLFDGHTGASGVPKGFRGQVKPCRHDVEEAMHEHRGAHMWLLMLAAHRMAKEHGGALSEAEWPGEWTQAKRDAMEEADPMCMVVRKVVKDYVAKGQVVAKGETYEEEEGREVRAAVARVDSIKRSRLMNLIRSEAGRGGSHEMRGQSNAAKRRLNAEMEAHGYTFQDQDTTVHGVRVKDCYLGCMKLRDLEAF
jgi:hypothetical protein